MKNFLTAIALIFCFTAYSQTNSSVQVGTMVKQTMKESWADIQPIGQNNQGVFYIMVPYGAVIAGPVIGDSDYYIGLVNDQGELVKKQPVNFLVDGKMSSYEFTEELNGKILIFTSVKDKKAKTVVFYVHEVNKESLQLVNSKKVIQLSFAELKRDFERANFKSELSRDKSKMLISYSLLNDENSILAFGYIVLDASLKETFKWIGNLDMSDGVYLFDQFRISNSGEVYLLTRYFANEKALDKNSKLKKTNILATTRSLEYKNNYQQRVVRFTSTGETKIIPIPNEPKFYVSMDLEIASDGNLVLIGFYAVDDLALPSGAACLKINPKTGVITETGSKEFGEEYKMPSDITNKNNGLIAGEDQYLNYRFIMSDIKFNQNGGYTLIGERNVTQTKRSGNVIYTVNHLDDLAVIDVSAAGKVLSVTKVTKSQQVEDLEIFNASYFYMEHNNNKYFAFANMGKGSLKESVLVKLTPDGKQTREVLFTNKETEVALLPKDCEVWKGKKLIMYGQKNARYVRWLSKTL
jgi:hypothetical protein